MITGQDCRQAEHIRSPRGTSIELGHESENDVFSEIIQAGKVMKEDCLTLRGKVRSRSTRGRGHGLTVPLVKGFGTTDVPSSTEKCPRFPNLEIRSTFAYQQSGDSGLQFLLH